jgi:hypothetical protein
MGEQKEEEGSTMNAEKEAKDVKFVMVVVLE